MDTNTILLIGLGVVIVLSALGVWLANRDSTKRDNDDIDNDDIDNDDIDDANRDNADRDK